MPYTLKVQVGTSMDTPVLCHVSLDNVHWEVHMEVGMLEMDMLEVGMLNTLEVGMQATLGAFYFPAIAVVPIFSQVS